MERDIVIQQLVDEPQPCWFCDPYSYPWRSYDQLAQVCEAHAFMPMTPLQFGLPSGAQASWRRGVWK